MTEQKIFENIETILYNAEYTNKVHGFRFYAEAIVSPGDYICEFHNNTVELLRALYQKLASDKEKNFLLKNLEPRPGILSLLPNQPKTYQLAYAHQDFVFVFLIKIKELDKALKMLTNYIIVSSTNNNLFQALSEILDVEPSIFDNTKLNEILSIVDKFRIFINGLKYYMKDTHVISGDRRVPMYDIKKIADYKAAEKYNIGDYEELLDSITKRVYKIKEERLSASLLEGVNFEVNQDQTQLQGFISEFGFDIKLNELISKINEEIYSAKDSFDFTGCIGHIRTLFERLCVSTALEIEKKIQILSTDPPIDRMGKARAYFRYGKVNFLSQEEDDLIDRLFYFLSDKGSHALESEKEYARISRNLVIELGLFLAEKLKKYLSNP